MVAKRIPNPQDNVRFIDDVQIIAEYTIGNYDWMVLTQSGSDIWLNGPDLVRIWQTKCLSEKKEPWYQSRVGGQKTESFSHSLLPRGKSFVQPLADHLGLLIQKCKVRIFGGLPKDL